MRGRTETHRWGAGKRKTAFDGVRAASLRIGGVIALAWTLGVPALAAESAESFGAKLSAEGRFVAFTSGATDLAPGQVDHNGVFDVFLRDRVAGTTTLVSHGAGSSSTTAAGGLLGSFGGAISADGRYLTFLSDADDLVPEQADPHRTVDAFLYDRLGGGISLLSRAAGLPTTAADRDTFLTAISADGNYIAFTSVARNLLAGQIEGNGPPGDSDGSDVFLYHRPSGTVTLVSRRAGTTTTTANGDSVATGISADGSVVVFTSAATDLVASLSDSNGEPDVFVYQRASGLVSVVSRANGAVLRTSDDVSGRGQLSADGRWVAFQSAGTNLVKRQVETGALFDEFLFDRKTGEIRLVSHKSRSPRTAVGVSAHAFSAEGRYLAFTSDAPNLLPGQVDTNGKEDVFVYDRVAGTTALVTHRSGALSTATSGSFEDGLDIDYAGRLIAFLSSAPDVVAGQVDAGHTSVFLYDRLARSMAVVSHQRGAPLTTANGDAFSVDISGDGSTVGFSSAADDLTVGPPDPEGTEDVFVYLRSTLAIEGISRPRSNP
jgi:Tol biopolymer transport system component